MSRAFLDAQKVQGFDYPNPLGAKDSGFPSFGPEVTWWTLSVCHLGSVTRLRRTCAKFFSFQWVKRRFGENPSVSSLARQSVERKRVAANQHILRAVLLEEFDHSENVAPTGITCVGLVDDGGNSFSGASARFRTGQPIPDFFQPSHR